MSTITHEMTAEQQEIIKLASVALLELGNTVTEVIDTLNKYSIKGFPNSLCNCPITNYLHMKLSKFSPTTIETEYGPQVHVITAQGKASITLPRPVSDFIMLFDQDRMRELQPRFRTVLQMPLSA